MKNKIANLIFTGTVFLFLSLHLNLLFAQSDKIGIRKKHDLVPNEETAINVAIAIWLPIFGESISDKKPYKAILLKDSIWIVKGTPEQYPPGVIVQDGSWVPTIEIRKSDCKILKVMTREIP